MTHYAHLPRPIEGDEAVRRACHRFWGYAATQQARHKDLCAGTGWPTRHSHPVLWADQQTGYHDCRIALCVAMGVPLDLIDPASGHDLRGVA